jgi:hypothetical protein
MSEWPIPAETKYIPIESEEFERLVRGAVTIHPGNALQEPLLQSEYTASWSPGGDLFGNLKWTFQPSTAGSLIPLGILGGEIHNPRWENVEGAAVLGRDHRGQLWLQRTAGTTLLANWSQTPCQDGESNEFEFAAPPCAGSTLSILIPRGYTLDAAPVLQLEDVETTEQGLQYRYRFSHADRAWLRIRAMNDDPSSRSLLSRIEQEYTVEAATVDLVATIHVLCFDDRQSELRLHLDEGLELADAMVGKTPLTWSRQPGDRGGSVVRLNWTPTKQPQFSQLQLRATGKRPTGKSWPLPQIRPLATGFLPSSVKVTWSRDWDVQSITAHDATQTDFASTSLPAREIFSFAMHKREATVAFDCARRTRPAEFTAATQLKFADDHCDAKITLQLQPGAGLQPRVRGVVENGWQIESVDLLDADLPVDWTVEDDGNQTPRLVLRLPPGAMTADGARVVVAASRPFAQGQSLSTKDLRIVRFAPPPIDNIVAAVAVSSAQEIHLSAAAQAANVKLPELTASELAGFVGPPDGFLFRVPHEESELRIRLAPRHGVTCPLELHTEVTLHDELLEELCHVDCRPPLEGASHVVLRTTKVDAESWHWQLQNSGAGDGLTVSVTTESSAPSAPPEEIWDIHLDQTRDQPFTLVGKRVVSMRSGAQLSFPRAGGSAQKASTLFLYAEEGQNLNLHASGITPLADGEARQGSLVRRAAYTYDAPRDAPQTPALKIWSQSGDDPLPGAWAWEAQLESCVHATGNASHSATYQFEVLKTCRLELRLPVSSFVDRIHLAGNDYAPDKFDDGGGIYHIPLTPSAAGACLRVDFQTRQTLPSLAGRVRPPWPIIDFPILAQRWSLIVPPGYSLDAEQRQLLAESAASPNVARRLFGWLGRDRRDVWQNCFWPFRRDDADEARSLAAVELLTRSMEFESRALAENTQTPPTWAEFLENWQLSEIARAVTLRLDAQGLQAVGIEPNQPWNLETARGIEGKSLPVRSTTSFAQFLNSQGLVLVVCDNVALITSKRAAAELEPQILARAIQPGICFAKSPALLQALQRSATDEHLRFLSIDAWRRQALSSEATTDSLVSQARDWQETGQTITTWLGPVTNGAWVGCEVTLAAWAWLLFLSALAVAMRLQLSPALGLLCTLAIVALWVPPVWIPCASALVLGSTLGICWPGLIRLFITLAEKWTASRKRVTLQESISQFIMPVAILFALSRTSGDATLGETTAKSANAMVPIVFVPTDELGQPTGARVHVPLELYQTWLQRAVHTANKTPSWIVTESKTTARLLRPEPNRDIGCTVTDSLSIQTFLPDLRLALKELQTEVSVAKDHMARGSVRAVLIDGQPISPTGSAASSIELREPGVHRVQVERLRVASRDVERWGVNLSVPRVASGSLELDFPANLKGTTVNGRAITVGPAQPSLMETRGGFGDEWRIRWRSVTEESEPPAVCDTLVWRSAVDTTSPVNVRLEIAELPSPISVLTVVCDPDWLMTPAEDDPGLVVSVLPSSHERDHWQIVLAEPLVEQGVIPLSLAPVQSSATTGEISIPRVLGTRPGKSWLAIGHQPTAQSENHAAESPLCGDFARKWGDESQLPSRVVAADGKARSWTLENLASTPTWHATASQQILIDEQLCSLDFRAQLTASESPWYQLEASIPASLDDLKVTVEEEGKSILLRSFRRAPDRLVLLLTQRPREQATVRILGRQRTMVDVATELPTIRLRDCDGQLNVSLYHDERALLEVAAHSVTTSEDAPHAEPPPQNFHRAARFSLAPESIKPTITLHANRPQVRGAQRLTLVRTVIGWKLTSELDVQATGGQVDQIEYELPKDLPRSVRIQSADPSEFLPGNSGSGPRIVTRLSAPLVSSGKYELEIELPREQLELSGVPDVCPMDMELARELILPGEAESAKMSWDLRNLTPLGVGEKTGPLEAATAYRVTGAPFVARWTERVQRGEAPFSLRQDAWLIASDPERGVGYVRQDLHRLGDEPVTIHPRESQQIIDVQVGGVRPCLRRAAQGALEIQLGKLSQPMPLEVLYLQNRSPDLSPPSIIGLECRAHQLLLWDEERTNTHSADRIAPRTAALDRLRAISQVLAQSLHADDPFANRTYSVWRETWRRWQVADDASLSSIDLDVESVRVRDELEQLRPEPPKAENATQPSTRHTFAERKAMLTSQVSAAWRLVRDSTDKHKATPPDQDETLGARVWDSALLAVASIGLCARRREIMDKETAELAALLGLGLLWTLCGLLPWAGGVLLLASGYVVLSSDRPTKAPS